MLDTFRACPATGDTELSLGFKKDLQWFAEYLPSTNGVYIMHANIRVPVHLYIDGCSMGAGSIAECQAYHAEFPAYIINAEHLIFHLELINAVAASQTWVPQFCGKLVHLYSNYTTTVVIFQASRSKDRWIQVCARQLRLTCATYDITLAVGHISGEHLSSLADAISHWHTCQHYKDCVNHLVQDRGIKLIEIPCDSFQLSTSL